MFKGIAEGGRREGGVKVTSRPRVVRTSSTSHIFVRAPAIAYIIMSACADPDYIERRVGRITLFCSRSVSWTMSSPVRVDATDPRLCSRSTVSESIMASVDGTTPMPRNIRSIEFYSGIGLITPTKISSLLTSF